MHLSTIIHNMHTELRNATLSVYTLAYFCACKIKFFFCEINRRIIVIIVVYKKMYFMLSRPQNFWISTRCHHTWRLNWIKNFAFSDFAMMIIPNRNYKLLWTVNSICFYIYCNVIITYRTQYYNYSVFPTSIIYFVCKTIFDRTIAILT